MKAGGTSIRCREIINFSLHLFCSFWHNFEEQMIKLPTLLYLIIEKRGGRSNCKFLEKNPQVYLINIWEWPKYTPTILRNLNNFLLVHFIRPPTIRHKKVSVFFSFCQRDIKYKTVFIEAKLLLADWFLFSMRLIDPLRKVTSNMVNIKTYKFISRRRIAVPKFQRNRSVLSNVTECGYLTAICYSNILIFHILQEDLIFRQRS